MVGNHRLKYHIPPKTIINMTHGTSQCGFHHHYFKLSSHHLFDLTVTLLLDFYQNLTDDLNLY